MTNQPGEEAADKLQRQCRLQWPCAGQSELLQAPMGHGCLKRLRSSSGSWQEDTGSGLLCFLQLVKPLGWLCPPARRLGSAGAVPPSCRFLQRETCNYREPSLKRSCVLSARGRAPLGHA